MASVSVMLEAENSKHKIRFNSSSNHVSIYRKLSDDVLDYVCRGRWNGQNIVMESWSDCGGISESEMAEIEAMVVAIEEAQVI